MPTNPLTAVRYPDSSYSGAIYTWIQQAVDDISKLVKPRFTNATTRDAAYAAWVAAGNTMVAGMECFTTDLGLHWSYTGSAWFITNWSGSDQTKQPMISLSQFPANLVNGTSLFEVTTWGTTVNQGNGLLSVVSGRIRCNVPGKVRVQGYADSNGSDPGWSWLAVNQNFASGSNGDLIPGLHTRQGRQTGYSEAGKLLQMVQAGPVPVKANDTFSLSIAQTNTAAATIAYAVYLTVSYV